MVEEIKRSNCIDNVERLLFDILQELRQLNKGSEKPVEVEVPQEKPKSICKTCGKTHDKLAEYSACAKNRKKVS